MNSHAAVEAIAHACRRGEIRSRLFDAGDNEVEVGPYLVDRVIGQGGAAIVFRGRRDGSEDRIALKLFAGNSEASSQRFRREATVLSRVEHPNIVRCWGHGSIEPGLLYIEMEWLQGTDLRWLMRRRALSIEETIHLGIGVASGLVAAHAAGLVHRDIKPANIFLADGRARRVRLIDFGLARAAADPTVTAKGAFVGTPEYAAPEQIMNASSVSPSTDLYALGVVLFEALCGRPPFQAKNPAELMHVIAGSPRQRPSELVEGVPEQLDELVFELLQVDPDTRPGDAAQVLGRLRPLAAQG